MNATTQKPRKSTNIPLIKGPEIEKKGIIKTVKKTVKSAAEKSVQLKKTTQVAENQPSPNNSKKQKPAKVIRDSFSFPVQDYAKISELKKTCLAAGIHVKKNEILRAGLILLTKLDLTELTQLIDQVEKIRTGRPKSGKKP